MQQSRLKSGGETITRLLEELCRPGALERVREGERTLKDYVEAEARDISAEMFAKLMADLHSRIQYMIKSPDPAKKLGAVLGIDELVLVKAVQDDAARTAGFSLLLRRLFEEVEDMQLLECAAQALGHLVRNSGQSMSDIVERQVREALPWLNSRLEPSEYRRYAAVLVCREMASEAPAVFNVHVKAFLDGIWGGLRDQKLHVREASVQALERVLVLVEKRETRYRVQWYYGLYEATMRSLNREPRTGVLPSAESIHGGLLALGELLMHTGEFLLARYREVVETVLRFKDSKEKLIRRAVIRLLPRLAAFAPERFAQDYLHKCIAHLLAVLKHTGERGTAFAALADMAGSLAAVGCQEGFEPYLPAIAAQLRESLIARTKGKPGGNVTEALQCVGVLASALHVSWQPYAQQLLDCMMHTGPSQNLVQALSDIATALPDLLEDIQAQLLDLLSLILQTAPKTLPPQTKGKQFQALIHSLSMSDLGQSEQIKLALNTIGTMDFGRVVLIDFMKESILPYIDDADKEIRQAAALACCRILERHAATNSAAAHGAAAAAAAAAAGLGLAIDSRGNSIAAPGLSSPVGYPLQQQMSPAVQTGMLLGYGAGMGGLGSSLKQTKAVEAVVGKLLMAAVADTSERVRRTVLEALAASPALDNYLAQADCLRALFVALNDESRDVRATAIKLVGRLASQNPAYVAPALRRHLLQLLTDMDHSPDSKQRDDSAYLLNCLINSAPGLVMHYISPIQKALVTKLKGSSGNTTPTTTPGGAQGALVPAAPTAIVGSSGVITHPGAGAGTNALNKDKQGAASSEAGVIKSVLATLGALAQQAGIKFKPYVDEIVPLVIEAIQDVGAPSKRRAAVITLGQICQSTGHVMKPYWDFPQLLALLLRLLHEGNIQKGRCEVMRVLGIIGALDPYTHKVNTASLSGEGKLELEGVRPLRTNAAAAANIAASIMAGTPLGGLTGGPPGPPGTTDDFANDLLPAAGLVTSSEDYYPTVAINALMRVLRDSGLSSQHQAVISSLMQIFKALGTASVPYLPKVLPVLFAVLRVCDEPLRELLLEQLVVLIVVVRQHIRRFLPDLLGIMGEFWGRSSKIQHVCLQMLAELAISLRDDLRPYIPELLPRLVALFVDAERNSTFDMVKAALMALEALGVALEEQLHLLLPALMRLVAASGSSTPLEIRRAVLKSMKRLLPRMHLAGFSSAVLQPLMKVLDGPNDDLRRDALDTICALAVALGQDFNIFVPTIEKIVARHRVQHEWFLRLAHKLNAEPPCCSDAEDWEDAGGWAAELDHLAEQAAVQPPVMPLDPVELASPTGTVRPGICFSTASNMRVQISLHKQLTTTPAHFRAAAPVKLAGQIGMLRKAWESSARVTKDDWSEWMRHFSVELLAQSPSPALRACHSLAQVHPTMARELFAAGFVSCWAELDPASQEQLVRSLEAALASPTIPPEIVTALLNLAEFMEHDDKRLPLDTRTLGALAEKCHAFAKALHYKEMEFQTSPQTAIEALIHINNQLRQPEAAVGVLTYAQKHLAMELKESWYEKLCRWDEALAAYEGKLAVTQPNSQEYLTALLGKMRCLASLAEWEKLSNLCRTEWRKSEPHMRKEMSLIAAHAAWHMSQWEEMAIYVDTVDSGPGGSSSTGMTMSASFQALTALQHNHAVGGSAAAAMAAAAGVAAGRAQGLGILQGLRSPSNGRVMVGNGVDTRQSHAAAAADAVSAGVLAGGPTSSTGAFLRAVLCIKHDQHDLARYNIERARDLMSTELAALVGESYERAYTDMVRVQQLTELEEVIGYKEARARAINEPAVSDEKVNFIRASWRRRLGGVQRNVEVWQSLFSVRSLVVPMHEDVDAWLKFASLCRKSGRPRQAARMLVQLLGYDPQTVSRPGHPGYGAGSGAPAVMLAYCKHLWAVGQRNDALGRMRELVEEVRSIPAEPPAPFVKPDLTTLPPPEPPGSLSQLAAKRFRERPRPSLHAKCFLRLGLFQWHLQDGSLANEGQLNSCMELMRAATEYGANWPKAWHHRALFNCGVLEALHKRGEAAAAGQYVAPAVTGFFRSVALGQAAGDRTGNLQDILRLLTLWFTWGSAPDVEAALQEGFGLVSIDTWLVVIPQVIARIHTNNPQVRNLIHSLLVRIGRHHPQALMYPLLVAAKSQSPSRRQAAYNVIDVVRTHSATLVEQAQLVSQELIRIAILWHEMWHEALEEASRLYFGESNVEAMLQVLLPLHELMEKTGPSTLKEIAFVQAYGRELSEAYEWLSKFRLSRKEAELHQAWDLYYHVFKRINKQLHSMTTLELQYVAPALVRAQGMELAVPGTYIAGEPLVTIAAFAPQLQVISSKQRPRKLTIHGGDGAEYMFLLKGHEDLRQDERVMQLFGLVNSMLSAERSTAERDLSIARYAVIPLSPNSGLIGWVPNCDTLHALIREYRDSKKIPLNWEHRLMLGMAPDYDHLPVIHKVEVFEYALDSTSGEDLHKVLWLKSRNSEVWLDRRTTYTRSTAVMSMVGYLLGLGDRHPSNLMLDRYSGKLLHIDFGDCFEASMNRDKFPEKVPFRLTRMMIKAMEVSGIEGNFRTTCEAVLRVLRANKDSLMAMLEAFVHDPLINWRLLNTTEAATEAALARESQEVAAAAAAAGGPGPAAMNAAAGAVATGAAAVMAGGPQGEMPSPPQRGARERELREARDQLRDQLAGDASEVLNERAMTVMRRMTDKLMGRDHIVEGSSAAADCDSVPAQVQRLIAQAISHENLCQSYIGWCPFW